MGNAKGRERFLVVGDYPVLESSFVSEVKAIRKRESFLPLLIFVSSKLLGLHLRRFLAEKEVPHFNLRFFTLEEFAREVSVPHLLAQGRRELPSYADELIVGGVATSLTGEAEEFYFHEIAGRPGFHQALLATIKDLKDGCLLPEDLERSLSDRDLSRQVHLPKLRGLLNLWRGYQERLKEIRCYDESDLMVFAAQWAGDSIFLKQTPEVLLYGFYDFNTAQKRLLQVCFEKKGAIAFLPYEHTPAFEFVKPALMWLKEVGFQEIDPIHPSPLKKSEAPQHLCQNLFDGKKPLGYEPKEIQIISAPGEVREVRETIRKMLQASGREGIPFHEVGILLRSPEEYSRLFRETCHALGIEPYLREGIPLMETRAGRSLKLLLNVMHQNFSRTSVMEFATFAKLRSNLFPSEEPFNKNPARWDAISMQAGIVEGEKEWEDRLRRLRRDWSKRRKSVVEVDEGKRLFDEEDFTSLDGLVQFIHKLFGSLRQLKESKTWKEKVETLLNTYDEWIEEDEEGLLVKESVRRLSELDVSGIPPSQGDFLHLVNRMLEEKRVPQGRFQRNGPTIANLMAVRGVPFRMVILPGMVEKSFPPLIRQDAILLDHERRALNRSLSGKEKEPLPMKAEGRLNEERLLFRLAIGSVREKLILSYPRIETGTGKERLPSSFLLALIEALTGRSVDFNQIEAFSGFLRVPLSEIGTKTPEEALDEVEYDLSFGQEKLLTKSAESLLYLEKMSPFFGRGLRSEHFRWGKREFTPYEGLLGSEEVRRMLRDRYSVLKQSISPTRLETYASCPFQYLLGVIMGVRGLTEPEKAVTISPLDRGKLVHDILYTFYTELKKERGRSLQLIPEDLKRLMGTAEKKFLEFEETGVTGFPMFWEVEKRNIQEQLEHLFHQELQEREFIPTYFEVRYGMKGFDLQEGGISTEEPITLQIKGRTIHLWGRIDRIDLTRDGKKGRVMDYKTGNVTARKNEFQGGRTLQLPLYLYAARQLLRPHYKGIQIESAQYYSLPTGKRIPFEWEKLEEKEGELQEILKTLVHGIEDGIFVALPDSKGCRYRTCDFKRICGSWTPILFHRKSKDPKVKRFLEVIRELSEEGEE